MEETGDLIQVRKRGKRLSTEERVQREIWRYRLFLAREKASSEACYRDYLESATAPIPSQISSGLLSESCISWVRQSTV